jgi:hypothetical protein
MKSRFTAKMIVLRITLLNYVHNRKPQLIYCLYSLNIDNAIASATLMPSIPAERIPPA